jgi:hypothetical protein
MNEPTGQILGSNVGKVVAVGKDSKGRFWDDHMRIRVLMPVDKPLTRWLKVKDKVSGDMLRLHVKYERIPKFCRYCGHVGHVEKDCLLPKKDRRVRFGLHLRASPEKKFVTPIPDRQNVLAKRNLNFDGQDDDRLQPDKHGKGKETDRAKEQPAAGKSTEPNANEGGGSKEADATHDIARKVQALGLLDRHPVIPPIVFKGGCSQTPAGGIHGEEVGDNGLAPQAPVQSVLHNKMSEVERGVAKEWEDHMAETKLPTTQRKFKVRHCFSSDNSSLMPMAAMNHAAVDLGSFSEEVRRARDECPTMSDGEAERLVKVCRGDYLDPELREIVQHNALLLKHDLGILGKRRHLDINVVNQDLSASSEVLEDSSKRRKVQEDNVVYSKEEGVQLSINLTGPQGEARQEP